MDKKMVGFYYQFMGNAGTSCKLKVLAAKCTNELTKACIYWSEEWKKKQLILTKSVSNACP